MSDPIPDNPYVLNEADITEPPTHWLKRLGYVGPGFILSASIVGSGELIMTTSLGAKAGFVTLWVVLLSCLVKVAVQLEFGKHAIYSGDTAFSAFNKLPGPRFGKANWSIWTFLLLMILKFFQVGGVMGGIVLVMKLALPGVGGSLDSWLWCGVIGLSVSLLVYRGYYAPIEKASIVLIGLFTLTTLAAVFLLSRTPYAVSWADIGGGLTFHLPAAAVAVAIAAFGITGVGGDEIIMYNYWLLEKGYAAKTGPRRDTEEWVHRAKGWIRIMYLDALLAMVGYTVVTAAFFILGAAVLHRQGADPGGTDLIKTLSSMYTETLGPWASGLFLGGAFVVLYSTLLSALAGWSRLFTDVFAQIGLLDFKNGPQRRRIVAWIAWVVPVLWGLLYLKFENPAYMVSLGGIATSAILLIVVYAAIHFRYRLLPHSLKPTRLYDVVFWVSIVSILMVGVYSFVQSLPKSAATPAPATATEQASAKS